MNEQAVEAMLAGDDYFTCRRNCRMPKATCITRQTVGVFLAPRIRSIPWECRDCETGALIQTEAKRTGGPLPEQQQPKPVLAAVSGIEPVKTANNGAAVLAPAEKETEADMKRKCGNCEREQTIRREGLCFTCATAAAGKTGSERESALGAVRRRIECGEVYRGGGRRATKVPAAPRNSAALSPALPAPAGTQTAIVDDNKSNGPEPQTVIPVTLRLTVEIAVRVTGIVA